MRAMRETCSMASRKNTSFISLEEFMLKSSRYCKQESQRVREQVIDKWKIKVVLITSPGTIPAPFPTSCSNFISFFYITNQYHWKLGIPHPPSIQTYILQYIGQFLHVTELLVDPVCSLRADLDEVSKDDWMCGKTVCLHILCTWYSKISDHIPSNTFTFVPIMFLVLYRLL